MLDRVKVRERLWNPPNGRMSSELEIVTEPVLRQRRIQTSLQYERDQCELRRIAREQDARDALEAVEAKRQAAATKSATESGDALPPLSPRYSAIMAEVCRRYKVTPIDLISSRRTADVVLPRQITVYLARHLTTLSLPQIGQRMGGRDHTTIMHAINKITGLVENSPHLAAEMDDITRDLQVRTP